MLNIYYGAEITDKEKFIFENIKGKTLLLVPDQFSLQAEKDAFFYLGKKSLIDLRIVDFNMLGNKVLKETGGRKPQLIDKYGSQMLLTKVLGKVDDELGVYRGFSWKSSFIDRVYGVISDMKRYGIEPGMLSEIIEKLDKNSYLRYKLTDINKIYAAYQELIEDKYLDAEDYILFYGEKLLDAPMVKESEIWIYGFDTFTPKNLLIIERLIKASRKVNIVMTWEKDSEIFDMTGSVVEKLRKTAEDINEEVTVLEISGESKKTVWSMETPDVSLVSATNIYAEAERAAAYILSLVRDHGYRFGEIVIVCNDMDTRGGIIRRVFKQWGIPLFVDRKRKVMHHPAVGCLLAVMEIVSRGYRTESVMKLIKSGFLNFTYEECDLLENYVASFKIRGRLWQTEFTRTGGRYTQEELDLLNSLREVVVETVEKAAEAIGRYNTASEKTRGLYAFLEKDFDMPSRIEALIRRQEEAGFAEGAAETAQSWSVICSILDQIVEILGDEKVSNEELLRLMTIGMERVEIGLVPVTSDRVIMGTLQRTRLSRIRALLVVGVNAGILPMQSTDEGLISDREKGMLEELNVELSKRDYVVRSEEKLAIYRMMHLPEEKLYMSCSQTGESGDAQRASEVFEKTCSFMQSRGALEMQGDIEESPDVFDMLTSEAGTLSYMTDALRKYIDGEKIDDKWFHIINWYEENRPYELEKVKAGMMFDNTVEAIGRSFSDALYRGDKEKLEVSASRLEKYSGCPFAHFIMYGLKAQSPVVYEMGSREIGDIYHRTLMKLSYSLTPPAGSRIAVDDPASRWMTVTEEECRQEIIDILSEDADTFKEGIMGSGRAESYRTGRIAEICSEAAWSMIKQVRKGNIRDMYFEQPFGVGRRLPPVCVDAGGSEVLIQGKIDRLDVFHEDSVRVVDYKSGNAEINIDHITGGYKLQLMVYLKAAMGGFKADPAGVFYFKISDLETDADKSEKALNAAVSERIDKSYRLVGIMLDDSKTIGAMDTELAEGETSESTVLPLKVSSKDGKMTSYSDSCLLDDVDFGELMTQVDSQVQRICTEICDGRIDIRPKKEKKKFNGEYKTACRYCEYAGICMFDTSFGGCGYEMI